MVAQRYFVALGRHLPADDSRPLMKTTLNGAIGDHRRWVIGYYVQLKASTDVVTWAQIVAGELSQKL